MEDAKDPLCDFWDSQKARDTFPSELDYNFFVKCVIKPKHFVASGTYCDYRSFVVTECELLPIAFDKDGKKIKFGDLK